MNAKLKKDQEKALKEIADARAFLIDGIADLLVIDYLSHRNPGELRAPADNNKK